jgi:hypothetical protein
MAFEAIGLHAGVLMAAGAKVPTIGNLDTLFANHFFRHVTVDAVLKTVPLGAQTVVHRVVTLVPQQIHMVATHEGGVFNAVTAQTRHGFWHRHFTRTSLRAKQQAEESCQ